MSIIGETADSAWGGLNGLAAAIGTFLVAATGVVYREATRKDTRADRVTAGQINDLKADKVAARQETVDAYEERDVWMERERTSQQENTALKVEIAQVRAENARLRAVARQRMPPELRMTDPNDER